MKRTVVGTFSATITHNIYAKQPLQSFANLKKNPVERNLRLYLFYRSESPLDAKTHVLDKINEMIAFLAAELGETRESQKEDLRQRLCDNLGRVGHTYNILEALKDGMASDVPSRLTKPTNLMEKLIAAICLDLKDPLEKPMGQLLPYHCGTIFGGPLEVAVLLGHDVILKRILNHLEQASQRSNITFDWSCGWLKPFRTAISAAIAQDNFDLVSLLARWYQTHIGGFSKVAYNEFLNRAIQTSSLETLRSVMEMELEESRSSVFVRVTQLHYKIACSQQRADIVKLFLRQGHIKLNDKMLTTSLLMKAVCSNSVEVVKVVLAAGADPNATSSFRGKKDTPMNVAIWKKNQEMIQCLLDAGAALPNIAVGPRHQKGCCNGRA